MLVSTHVSVHYSIFARKGKLLESMWKHTQKSERKILYKAVCVCVYYLCQYFVVCVCICVPMCAHAHSVHGHRSHGSLSSQVFSLVTSPPVICGPVTLNLDRQTA